MLSHREAIVAVDVLTWLKADAVAQVRVHGTSAFLRPRPIALFGTVKFYRILAGTQVFSEGIVVQRPERVESALVRVLPHSQHVPGSDNRTVERPFADGYRKALEV